MLCRHSKRSWTEPRTSGGPGPQPNIISTHCQRSVPLVLTFCSGLSLPVACAPWTSPIIVHPEQPLLPQLDRPYAAAIQCDDQVLQTFSRSVTTVSTFSLSQATCVHILYYDEDNMLTANNATPRGYFHPQIRRCSFSTGDGVCNFDAAPKSLILPDGWVTVTIAHVYHPKAQSWYFGVQLAKILTGIEARQDALVVCSTSDVTKDLDWNTHCSLGARSFGTSRDLDPPLLMFS